MKRVKLGTPTDLKEAIVTGLQEILVEQEITRDHRLVKRFHDIIQDRLSQSFSVGMCDATKTSHTEAIMKLWYSIFPAKKKN